MRDQIPLHRPLFGVEPSGHYLTSNRRANCEEWQICNVFFDASAFLPDGVVKNSDTLRRGMTRSGQVIFK